MAANKATPNVYQLLPAILCLDPNIGMINRIFQGCIRGPDKSFEEKGLGSTLVFYIHQASRSILVPADTKR